MKRFRNSVDITGYIFNFGSDRKGLSQRISKKGVPFIMGDINIATDDTLMNIVTVHYSYVPETTSNGKPNQIYTNLTSLLENGRSVESNGKENATIVNIVGEYETNDFWSARDKEFVSTPRIRGSFIHERQSLGGDAATFDVEVLISNARELERDGKPYVALTAYTFGWRGNIMPIPLEVHDPRGMDYFLGLDASNKNPILTRVMGNIVNRVINIEGEEDEGAWSTQKRTIRKVERFWDVTWSSAEPMPFDDPTTMTKEELKTALAEREEFLAETKRQQEEYQQGKSAFSGNKPKPQAKTEDEDEEYPF